ncbi:hypothetical protein CR513_19003, partial [Mucuna pruriens]
MKDSNWLQDIIDKPKDNKVVVRLIADGYTQTYDIDYEETFSLVVKMNIVRIILSPIAHFGYDL